jgi:hypothetical protein
MININQLEEFIKRDINDTQSYPFMVIANAGQIFLFNIIKKFIFFL